MTMATNRNLRIRDMAILLLCYVLRTPSRAQCPPLRPPTSTNKSLFGRTMNAGTLWMWTDDDNAHSHIYLNPETRFQIKTGPKTVYWTNAFDQSAWDKIENFTWKNKTSWFGACALDKFIKLKTNEISSNSIPISNGFLFFFRHSHAILIHTMHQAAPRK